MTQPNPDNPVVRTVPIADLAPQAENANRGTARGRKALKASLKKHGAGRSILLDKNFSGARRLKDFRGGAGPRHETRRGR